MKEVQMAHLNTSQSIINDFPVNSIHSQSKYLVEFNRILHSQRCIYFYIFLIVSSITVFVYSLLAYFFKWDELPIVICESFLIIVITFDMMIRVYVTVKKLLKYLGTERILL
jgi:hypothetical protein